MNLLKENLGQTFHNIAIKHYPAKQETKESLLEEFGFDSVIEREKLNKKTRKNIETFGELIPVSEIIRIGTKYRLRLGRTDEFAGGLDENIFEKMSSFKTKLEQSGQKFEKRSLCILAPQEMFSKDAFVRKDPVLFYRVNKDYYYLIHQWGGEMNRLRAFYTWPVSSEKNLKFIFFVPSLIGLCFGIPGVILGLFTGFVSVIATMFSSINRGFSDDSIEDDVSELERRWSW